MRIEETFGLIKVLAGQHETRFRGRVGCDLMWWTASSPGITVCQSVAVESHMRESRHPHRAQLIDEVFRVVGLVRAELDRLWPVGARLDHVQCCYRFGMPVSERQAGVDQQALAVLHQACPMKHSLASLPLP